MTWRVKSLLFIAVCFSLFVALVAGASRLILLPRVQHSEVAEMQRSLGRVLHRVERELESLAVRAAEYAPFDETYDFVATRAPGYLEANLNGPMMSNAGFAFCAIWDEADRPVGGRYRTREGEAPQELPEALWRELAEVPGVFQKARDGRRTGVVRTSLGPMLISAQPVLRSDFSGPVRGTLVAGEWLDDSLAQDWQRHEAFAVAVRPAPVGEEVAETTINLQAPESMVGRKVLTGLDGRPAALLELRAGLPLMTMQRDSLRLFVLVIAGVSLALCLGIWVAVELVFIRRLERLMELIGDVERPEKIAELQAFTGEDEVGQLARRMGGTAHTLREARELAVSADRAKSEFLAVMSHELRTPMNGVLGFTSLLRGTPLTVEQLELVRTVEQSGETLLAVINQILDFSKLEAGKLVLERQPVVVRELVGEVGRVLAVRIAEQGLTYHDRIAEDVPQAVQADPLRLRQVLLNLINNAVKFTPRGEVTVEVAVAARAGDGRMTLRFRVADTGIGIGAAERARLFKSFSQADTSTTRKYGGTGLGLVICKRIVEAGGGAIIVESEPGRGSTFSFTLETEAVEPLQATRVPFGSRAGFKPGVRVLAVEDNEVNRRMLATMLKRLGYPADFAEDGRQALTLFKRERPYDIVLMDVLMPEMDGLEATRELRRHEQANGLQPAWVIALTASAMQGDRERCLAAGMDDYLAKPLKLEDLESALARVPQRRPSAG